MSENGTNKFLQAVCFCCVCSERRGSSEWIHLHTKSTASVAFFRIRKSCLTDGNSNFHIKMFSHAFILYHASISHYLKGKKQINK